MARFSLGRSLPYTETGVESGDLVAHVKALPANRAGTAHLLTYTVFEPRPNGLTTLHGGGAVRLTASGKAGWAETGTDGQHAHSGPLSDVLTTIAARIIAHHETVGA